MKTATKRKDRGATVNANGHVINLDAPRRKPGRPARPRLETDGLRRRGRPRRLSRNGYTHMTLKPEDLNRLNTVGKDIARKTGLTVSAREVVAYLSNRYIREMRDQEGL